MCNFLHFTMVVMCLIIENYIICVIHNLRQQLQKHQASKRKSKQSNFIYLSMVCFVLFVAAVAAARASICLSLHLYVCQCKINYTWILCSQWAHFTVYVCVYAICLTIKNVQKSFSVIIIFEMTRKWSVLFSTPFLDELYISSWNAFIFSVCINYNYCALLYSILSFLSLLLSFLLFLLLIIIITFFRVAPFLFYFFFIFIFILSYCKI